MAEEQHRCQAPPEGHRLCANNCGFFGNSSTMNLCSKCYRDHCLKEKQEAAIIASLSVPSPLSPPPLAPPSTAAVVDEIVVTTDEVVEVKEVMKQVPNRCFICKKRVGLTGFRCRCESMFCGTHRYPEKHECNFDYKKIGKEEIAKANPLVIANKLNKI